MTLQQRLDDGGVAVGTGAGSGVEVAIEDGDDLGQRRDVADG